MTQQKCDSPSGQAGAVRELAISLEMRIAGGDLISEFKNETPAEDLAEMVYIAMVRAQKFPHPQHKCDTPSGQADAITRRRYSSSLLNI